MCCCCCCCCWIDFEVMNFSKQKTSRRQQSPEISSELNTDRSSFSTNKTQHSSTQYTATSKHLRGTTIFYYPPKVAVCSRCYHVRFPGSTQVTDWTIINLSQFPWSVHHPKACLWCYGLCSQSSRLGQKGPVGVGGRDRCVKWLFVKNWLCFWVADSFGQLWTLG